MLATAASAELTASGTNNALSEFRDAVTSATTTDALTLSFLKPHK